MKTNNNERIIEEQYYNENVLRIENGKYHFQGQAFSKKSWYRKMANYLRFDKDEVILRRTPDEIRLEYIKTYILKNIKGSTFYMLILPCALFLVLSLVLFLGAHTFQIRANYFNYNQLFFIRFLAGMFLLFGSALLIKLIILQDKVIMTGSDRRVRMKHISKKQYIGIMNVFKKE